MAALSKNHWFFIASYHLTMSDSATRNTNILKYSIGNTFLKAKEWRFWHCFCVPAYIELPNFAENILIFDCKPIFESQRMDLTCAFYKMWISAFLQKCGRIKRNFWFLDIMIILCFLKKIYFILYRFNKKVNVSISL